jgi:DNA-binding Lrp family transcriptional regulator
LKDTELRLVSELMRNSRRSDRELVKPIGISQPTVSRTIARLEKEGVLKVIPDFRKLGYNLVAMTFGPIKDEFRNPEKIGEARRAFKESFDDRAFEVVLNERGIGLGYDGIVVSFHSDYAEYADFKRWMKQLPFINASRLDSFIIDLNDELHFRYLTFSYLAQHLLQAPDGNEDRSRSTQAAHSN